jgi:putative endonuclease
MTFWVYILRCADNSYYTGHTDNLDKRIGEHQTGACGGYTAERLPVELVWSQDCATREEALAAELQIKGWSRKKKEAMMRGDWGDVNRLGRGKHQHQRNTSASTSVAAPPTLSTNGGNAVRHDPFDTPSVRPERSAEGAKSKGNANAINKE